VHLIREILKGLKARRVNGGHVSQAENDDRRQIRKLVHDLVEFIGGAE
jgi:hypothetical protein